MYLENRIQPQAAEGTQTHERSRSLTELGLAESKLLFHFSHCPTHPHQTPQTGKVGYSCNQNPCLMKPEKIYKVNIRELFNKDSHVFIKIDIHYN